MVEHLQDLVVAPNEFAYLLDSTKGNVDVLVGPHKTSLSGTDSPVIWDATQRRFLTVSTQDEAKQQFMTAPEGPYIVVENPVVDQNQSHPIKGARCGAVELVNGRKITIPGPTSFALFPGQSAEVIPGHHLRSNQYLVVRVYNDQEAMINWAQAVVKSTESGETQSTEEPIRPSRAPTDHVFQRNASFQVSHTKFN